MLSVTPAAFRAVMSEFATGVGVMTTISDGVPHGMTVNAVSSLSLEPLLVLVCVERDTAMAELVSKTEVFALSFLSTEQEHLSRHFADRDRPLGEEQFEGVATGTAVTGTPILEGVLGWVDCRTWALHDGGDHVIVVGEVVGLDLSGEADGLVYFRGHYRSVSAPQRT